MGMRLLDRAVFAVANLERGAGPALWLAIDHLLPRAMATALGGGFELVEDVEYHRPNGLPMHLDVVKPSGEGPFPVAIGIHGGAWMLGRKENIRHVGTYLARRGILTVLIDYRLAPAHPWPACAEDVEAAMRWTKANAHRYGGLGERVALFGDSAGGHLSAFGAVKIAGARDRAPDLPEVAATVLWYGVFDLAKFSRIPWRRTSQILEALFGERRAYDETAWQSMSPRAFLDEATRLQPTLIFAAGGDPLYSQSLMWARELGKRGVEVDLRKYKKTVHGFVNVPFSPEARASLKHAARWLSQHLAGGVSA